MEVEEVLGGSCHDLHDLHDLHVVSKAVVVFLPWLRSGCHTGRPGCGQFLSCCDWLGEVQLSECRWEPTAGHNLASVTWLTDPPDTATAPPPPHHTTPHHTMVSGLTTPHHTTIAPHRVTIPLNHTDHTISGKWQLVKVSDRTKPSSLPQWRRAGRSSRVIFDVAW